MKRLITLSLLYCPILLSAQGYQLQVQGQKQQAMGNAGTGLVQDGAAIFYNPGGVSFLKENSVSAGGNAAIVKSVFLDSITNTTKNSQIPVGTPITFYAVYGADSTKSKTLQNLKFGLGIYTPFGGSAKWPADFAGRFVIRSLDLKIINIQPTVSFKISDKIGVGAGLMISTGTIDFTKDVFLTNNTVGNYASAEVKGKLMGYGVNAGIYVKPIEGLSIGLTYRSQINMKSSGGTATFTNIPTQLRDSVVIGSGSTTGPIKTGATIPFPTPTVITLGIGYKLTDKFALALDINYLGFKIMDTLRTNFENRASGLKNVADVRGFKNVFTYHLGGQYMVTEALAVRLGVQYILTPIPNGYTTPEGADADHFAFSGGLGYKINKHFTVDASYAFQSVKRQDDNHLYNIIGTYKTYASIAGLSLAYHF